MTYRNDPYDPKQVALLDQRRLDDAVTQAEKAFADAADVDALAGRRSTSTSVTGRRSSLARREIGALPPQAKADAGKRVNEARPTIQSTFDTRLSELEADRARRALVEESVDVTLPWDRHPRGARHPLTTLMERIGDLFIGMGYEIAEGPEIELEWTNFDALNIGPDHPARGLMDTFYVPRRGGRAASGHGAAHAHLAGAGAHDAVAHATDLCGLSRSDVPHR